MDSYISIKKSSWQFYRSCMLISDDIAGDHHLTFSFIRARMARTCVPAAKQLSPLPYYTLIQQQ